MKRRPTTGALMPLAEAVARLTADLAPVPPVHVAMEAAVGAILAADVRAPADVPTRSIASRDGWAVAAGDVFGASPYAPVPLGSCPAWVDSGSALPAGCDTVLPPDAVQPSPPEALSDAALGDGVIVAGGDAPAGAVLAAAGTRLTLSRAAIVAMAGSAVVAIRRPRLQILAVRAFPPPRGEGRADAQRPTGVGGYPPAATAGADALGPPSGPPLRSGPPSPQGGRNHSAADDPLANVLAAYAAAWFGCVVLTTSAGDLAAALATETADATIVIGGTGYGQNDASPDILATTGVLTAHGIALRPGATAGFGSVAGKPVLLLPGRPEVALACFLVLGRPLLAHLAGATDKPPVLLPLARKITSTIGLSEIVFVQHGPDGLRPLGSADLPLHRLAAADGAVLVGPDREGYGQGVLIETILL